MQHYPPVGKGLEIPQSDNGQQVLRLGKPHLAKWAQVEPHSALAFIPSQPFLKESSTVVSLRHTQACFCLCCQTEYVLSNWISSTSPKLQQFLAWTYWTPLWFSRSSSEPLGGVMEEYFNNFGGCNENCNFHLCVLKMKVCFGVIFTSTVATWASEELTPRLVFLWSPDDSAKASKSPLLHGSYLLYSWDGCPWNPSRLRVTLTISWWWSQTLLGEINWQTPRWRA